jgi:hypothetical protein
MLGCLSLDRAKNAISSDELNYWQAVSHYVGTRSAEECSAFCLQDFPDVGHKAKPKEQKTILGKNFQTKLYYDHIAGFLFHSLPEISLTLSLPKSQLCDS